MTFAEARAKWVEFGANCNAALDYIETLDTLPKMVMLDSIFDASAPEHIYNIMLNKRFVTLCAGVRRYFLKDIAAEDQEIVDQFKQLKKEDEDTQK